MSVNAPRVNRLFILVKDRFPLLSFCYSPVSDPRSAAQKRGVSHAFTLATARRTRLRRGVQPRAVAGGGVGAGRGAHARGGRHAGLGRDLLLGHAGTPAGRVRVRLAGQGARPAARRGHRGRPGHADRGAAALVPAPAPRGPAGHPRRPAPRRRVAGRLLPVEPRVRERGGGITRQLAERYGSHPAVVLWHVNNEYGAPVGSATARPRRRRSATGCASATATWAPSTTTGARRSGRSATGSGTRSTRRGRPGRR